MKLSIQEIEKLLDKNAIMQAFFRRPDIACLPLEERYKRWEKGWPKIKKFMGTLSEMDILGVVKC